MKNILLLLATLGSLSLVNADEAKDTVSFRYLTAVKEDIEPIAELDKQFDKKPESFCPSQKGSDSFLCMSEYISGLTLKSSTQVILLLGRVVQGSALPSKKAGSRDKRLSVIENSLLVLEKTDLSKFHLSSFQVGSVEDQKELTALRVDDEKRLAQAIKKINGEIAKKLAEVEDSKEIKKSESESAKLRDLKLRFKNLKNRKWKYSA